MYLLLALNEYSRLALITMRKELNITFFADEDIMHTFNSYFYILSYKAHPTLLALASRM